MFMLINNKFNFILEWCKNSEDTKMAKQLNHILDDCLWYAYLWSVHMKSILQLIDL